MTNSRTDDVAVERYNLRFWIDPATMTQRLFESNEQDLLEEIMRLRRDVRGNRFLQKEVSDHLLGKIIRAGLYAPSVGFSQPWQIVKVRSQATKLAVADIFAEENEKAEQQFSDDKQRRYRQLKLEGITEAPVNLAVFYQPAHKPVLGQTSMSVVGEYSTVCAIQNMWLMARALNIGMGWVSILNPKKIETLFGAAQGQQFVAYLCLGYVDRFADRPELETLGWERRKQIEEQVFNESL